GAAADRDDVRVQQRLAAEEGDGFQLVHPAEVVQEGLGLGEGEPVGALEQLAVEAVPAREVAAVQQLQVEHSYPGDACALAEHGNHLLLAYRGGRRHLLRQAGRVRAGGQGWGDSSGSTACCSCTEFARRTSSRVSSVGVRPVVSTGTSRKVL